MNWSQAGYPFTDYLITVHSTPLGFLQEVKDRIQQDYLLMRSTGFAMALILQAMTDQLEPLIDQLDADITIIESDLSQLANQHDIQTIAEKKHQLASSRGSILTWKSAITWSM